MNCFSSSPRSWVSHRQFVLQVLPLLEKVEPAQGIGLLELGVDGLESPFDAGGRPATTAARAGRLQTFEIATDGEPLLPAFGKGRLVLHAHGPPRCTTLVIRHLPIFPLVRVRYAILDDKS